MEKTRWRAWGRYLAAGSAAAAISVFAFLLRSPVPIFDWVDLGVHELGHMIVMGGPRMLHFLAGSLLQVAVPAALAVYFLWRQKDLAGAGFCMAWAGTSAWDVSVYIADAPIQALPLIGGGTHDWAYLLGRQGWDAIDRAGSIAGFVDLLGMIAAGLGIGLAIWPAVRTVGSRRRASKVGQSASLELPVREPSRIVGNGDGNPGSHGGAIGSDPLDAAPFSTFPSEPELVPDPDPDPDSDPGPDPWLAASNLPFFHDRPEDRASH